MPESWQPDPVRGLAGEHNRFRRARHAYGRYHAALSSLPGASDARSCLPSTPSLGPVVGAKLEQNGCHHAFYALAPFRREAPLVLIAEHHAPEEVASAGRRTSSLLQHREGTSTHITSVRALTGGPLACRVVRARAEGPVTIEDVAALQSCSVLPVLGGPACTAGSLIAPDPALTLLIFFTHWCGLSETALAALLCSIARHTALCTPRCACRTSAHRMRARQLLPHVQWFFGALVVVTLRSSGHCSIRFVHVQGGSGLVGAGTAPSGEAR